MNKLKSFSSIFILLLTLSIPSSTYSMDWQEKNPLTIDEPLNIVFRHLPLVTLHDISLVSSQWNRIAKNPGGPFQDWIAIKQLHAEANRDIRTKPSLALCVEIFQKFQALRDKYFYGFRPSEDYKEYTLILMQNYSRNFKKVLSSAKLNSSEDTYGGIYSIELTEDMDIEKQQSNCMQFFNLLIQWMPQTLLPPYHCYMPLNGEAYGHPISNELCTKFLGQAELFDMETHYAVKWILSRIGMNLDADVNEFIKNNSHKFCVYSKEELLERCIHGIASTSPVDVAFNKINFLLANSWSPWTFSDTQVIYSCGHMSDHCYYAEESELWFPREYPSSFDDCGLGEKCFRNICNDSLGEEERKKYIALSRLYYESFLKSIDSDQEKFQKLMNSCHELKRYLSAWGGILPGGSISVHHFGWIKNEIMDHPLYNSGTMDFDLGDVNSSDDEDSTQTDFNSHFGQ